MEGLIKEILLAEVKNMEHLLYTDNADPSKWEASPEFTTGMKRLTDALVDRYFHRAALFGKHRTSGEKRRKTSALLDVKDSDFNLAWQTLEQDAQN
jgi:hypothetical protein